MNLRQIAVVFAVAGVFLAWTALPGPHWHDTAEFSAAAWRLTLSHPPGHPLHAIGARGVLLLPLGDVAFRGNLFSALSLAAALAVFYGLLRRLAPEMPAWAAASAALLPAVMPAVWLQGVRAEVYALQLVAAGLAVACCWRVADGDDDRALPAAALVFALGGANHTLIAASLLPLALLAMFVGVRRAQPLFWAAVAGALGLATYLYLPLRSPHGGEIGWGVVDSWSRFWATVSGRDWQKNLVSAPGDLDLAGNVSRVAEYALDQVGPLAALLLFALFVAGLPRLVRARLGLLVAAGLVIAAGFGTRLLYTFDPLNPDIGGYFAVPLLAILALAWVAAEGWLAPTRGWVAVLFPAALALAAPRYDPGHRRGARAAEQTARAMLDEVPIDGAIVYSDYASSFLAGYLRAAEGQRPDVALVFRGRLHDNGFRARLARTHAAWAAKLGAFPHGFEGPEVRIEPGVFPEQLDALADRLGPAGLTLASVPPGGGAARSLQRALAGTHADLDTRRSLAFLQLQQALHLLRRGRAEDAATIRRLLTGAERLAGPDPLIVDARALLDGGGAPNPL